MQETKTIIFVEDSEIELTAYRKVLEQAGYRVQAARDGLEAMRLLHKIVPDLVLLDLMLPRFNGVEVLKFIRSNARLKTIPVVIFSTNSFIDTQDEPLLEKTTKRLLKSQCTPAIMLQTLREVFSGKTVTKVPVTMLEEEQNPMPLTLELVAVMP